MKTIALVDWHWSGHHPTFFNHFVLALEQTGVRVLALCPDPDGAEKHAAATRESAGNEIPPDLLTQFRRVTVPSRRFSALRPRRITSIDLAIRRFSGIEDQARQWTRESGHRVDGIFHACCYDWDFEWMHVAEKFLKIPWIGLYLHALSYRRPGCVHALTGRAPSPRKMFGGSLCRGIGTLDEGIAEQAANDIGKPVVAVPDLADERPAIDDGDRNLGEQLKRFAAGRPIVGLFGYLQKSKGILTFLEAARLPGAADVCFALGGGVEWPRGDGEAARIQTAVAESPNVWSHLARIPTEQSLNHLLSSCDVIAASYVDFPHSSGIQAKAAAFGKPIIVSNDYLMAERARRFRMGEIVPQEEAGAFLDAVLRITGTAGGWAAQQNPLWREYGSEHSFERLKSSLAELVATI